MAGIKDFKKVAGIGATETVAGADVAKLQERLQEFFVPLVANPLLDGVLLNDVALTASATRVEHKLRRKPLGWIVVNKSANADVWQSANDLSTAFLTLQASGTVTVSLWIF